LRTDARNFGSRHQRLDQAFSRGIVHYNYRRIDEDIFAKAMKCSWPPTARMKASTITPAGITGPMAESSSTPRGQDRGRRLRRRRQPTCDFKRRISLCLSSPKFGVAEPPRQRRLPHQGPPLLLAQYQRVDQACAWVSKTRQADNGEL